MWEPVGPLPAAVYWRRRLLAVVTAATLLALLVWATSALLAPAPRPVVTAPAAVAAPAPPSPGSSAATGTGTGTGGPTSPRAGAGPGPAAAGPPAPPPDTGPGDTGSADAARAGAGTTGAGTTTGEAPRHHLRDRGARRDPARARPGAAVGARAPDRSGAVHQRHAHRVGRGGHARAPRGRAPDAAARRRQRQRPAVRPRPRRGPPGDRRVERGRAQRLWSSNDCVNPETVDVRTLVPGQPVAFAVRWAGRTSVRAAPSGAPWWRRARTA
jgi:hypothetical protein